MSELGETPNNYTLRLAKEKRITDFQNRGDAFHADEELDTYRYGAARPDLAASAFYLYLRRKGSKAARFFEKGAIAEASQETTESPAIGVV